MHVIISHSMEKLLKTERLVQYIMERTQGLRFSSFAERAASLHNTTIDAIFDNLSLVEWDDLVLFRYKQFAKIFDNADRDENPWSAFWNKFDGLYREMRSIVIDTTTCRVALYPFDKFFNINELEETSLENVKRRIAKAKNIEFSDKLDGSMVSARYYKGKLILNGSKSLNPSESWRLADNYRIVATEKATLGRMIKENPGYTFIFESLTPADVHVVKYNEDEMGMHLIGMRDMTDFHLLSYKEILSWAERYGVQTTTVFDKTIDEVMSELGSKRSDEKEGFVMNADGFMVKIKYDDYVQMHGIISKLSSVNLVIRAVADGTLDDVISKVPTAYRPRIEKIAQAVMDYESSCQCRVKEFYNNNKHLAIKDYALLAQSALGNDLRGAAISVYKGKPVSFIKRHTGGYKKLSDMGISQSELMELLNNPDEE